MVIMVHSVSCNVSLPVWIPVTLWMVPAKGDVLEDGREAIVMSGHSHGPVCHIFIHITLIIHSICFHGLILKQE